MLKHTEAVIFDLDGTLVDSMWMWKDIDIEFLSGYGILLPEDLQKAIEGMSYTDPAGCLVFEDIPAGILAGKRAGMRVCAVEDEYSADMREEKIRLSDYYIKDFTEVVRR